MNIIKNGIILSVVDKRHTDADDWKKEGEWMSRTILHSDCNCFYASVELLHHPELRGKPVAVGGDPEARHGIVLTAD